MIFEQFSGQKLKALLSLHFSKFNKKDNCGTMCDFERELGYRNAHPGIRDLFKYLIEIKVMIKCKIVMNVDFYYIDKKELKKIIYNQDILKQHSRYLEDVALLWQ